MKNIQEIDNSIVFPTNEYEGANFINTEPYYKWLASYVKECKPKRLLELGRRWGNSLYAMSFFLPDESILDSYDIDSKGYVINKPNVNIYTYDGDYTKIDYSLYDFIFIDINGSGTIEYEIYNLISKCNFNGVVAWDDVGTVYCPDENFWDKITTEKIKLSLHGPFNFGVTFHKKGA